MSAISITHVIDAAKNFVLRTRKAHINHITDIYIVSTQYDYMPDCVGLYITSCIVQYLVHNSTRKDIYAYDDELDNPVYESVTVYVATNGDLRAVDVYDSSEERDRYVNEYIGDRPYVYSNVSTKNVVKNINRSIDNVVLKAYPYQRTITKKITRASKPDRRRKCVYTYTTETQIIPYYDLTIYSQVSLPNYTSLSYAEMDQLFNLLDCWII